MPSLQSLVFVPVLAAAFASPVLAQESPSVAESVADRQGVIAYTPADFADARPNTALDMINRLPGFTLEGGDQVRGFAGAAGNVLIDGQRPTVKTDSVSDLLGRITIGQVERIDLIRGGAPGIDMQGRTVVANVIRKRIDTFQQVFEARSFLFFDTGHAIPGWNYQATRRAGEHQFDFSLSRGTSYDDSVGRGWRTTDYISTADPTLLETSETEADGMVHSARANYKGPLFGGTFSANGLVSTDEFKDEGRFYSATTDERFISRSANDRGEIGLNYTRNLTSSLELESLFLSKIAFGGADSSGDTGGSLGLVEIEAEAGETIGRGVLRYRHSPKLQFEGGGEAAYNYRDQSVALTVNGTPVPLPSSDVHIEELRYEGFVQGTWRPTTQLSFEAGVRIEQSEITQSGDNAKERSFNYPKPRFVATWSPTQEDQLRFRVEREVGQLNFQDFASEVDLNSGVNSTGNADLRPDKTWAYEVAYEKRFWGNGAAVLTLRHEEITDVVDILPFFVTVPGQPAPVLVSGPGNIGSGANDVVQASLTLPIERLGVKGGEFKLDARLQESEVTDPTTLETRSISGQRPDDVKLSYRQDLPAQNLTVGVNWYAGWTERRYRPTEVQVMDLRTFWGSFIEWKPNPSFTLRAELNNLDPYKFTIERLVYDDQGRGLGDLLRIENERRRSQVIGMLRARWSFG